MAKFGALSNTCSAEIKLFFVAYNRVPPCKITWKIKGPFWDYIFRTLLKRLADKKKLNEVTKTPVINKFMTIEIDNRCIKLLPTVEK